MLARHKERSSLRSRGQVAAVTTDLTSPATRVDSVSHSGMETRWITVQKAPGERLGITLEASAKEPSQREEIVISAVSRTSPLYGLVQAGERILSLDGMTFTAAGMASECVTLKWLTLVVAPPPEHGVCLSEAGPGMRQVLAPEVFAGVCPL